MFIPISDENHYYHRPYVNYALIGINVLVFLMVNGPSGDPRAVLPYGLVPYDPTAFTFLASMFLHAGYLHIIGNMLFLHITGDNVEAAFGYGKYAVFYLACGIFAALVHILVNPTSEIPLVGASGAISGVLGAYVLLCPKNKIRFWYFLWYFYWGTVDIRAAWAIGVYFAMQIFFLLSSPEGAGVAYDAHVGGFIAGLGLTYAALRLGFVKRERSHAWVRMPEARGRRTRRRRLLEPVGESFVGLAAAGGTGGSGGRGAEPGERGRGLDERPPRDSGRPPPRDPGRDPGRDVRPIEIEVEDTGKRRPLHLRDVIPVPRVPKRVLARAHSRRPRSVHLEDPDAYAVIRLDDAPIDTYNVGKIVAQETGVLLGEATSRIKTTRGFIVEEVPREQAEQLVSTLGAMGIKARAVPCRDMLSLPRAILLRGVRVTAGGMETRTEWEEFSILWSEIRLVSCGKIRSSKTIRETAGDFLEPASPFTLSMTPSYRSAGRSRPVTTTRTIEVEEVLIDIFHADPKLRFRLWEGRFAAEGLEGSRKAERMRDLARRIVDEAQGVFISPALTDLAQGGDLAKHTFGGRGAFERHNRYLFLLQRHAENAPRAGRGGWLEI